MDRAKEGTLRLLTLQEIALAHTVFGGSINYSRVWIHCDSYLPFGMQRRDTAMTHVLRTFGYRTWDIYRKQTYPIVTCKGDVDRFTLLSQYQQIILPVLRGG